MYNDTSFQSQHKNRKSENWGWYEDMPQHRIVQRFTDGGVGPRTVRPTFDPQPATQFGL
jgi:hypothetical protein